MATLGAVLGQHHPETLAVVANFALTLAALGRPDGPAGSRETLDELRRLLGDDNGIIQVASEGRRIYRDLEPLAV